MLTSKFTASAVMYRTAGDTREVHDPSLIKQGSIYYMFSTGRSQFERIPIRCSPDLRHWRRCGDVFPSMPDCARAAVPAAKDLWAPDISYFNGRYHLYYAVSTFGHNDSAICLAINETLDSRDPRYRWRDEGIVIRSQADDDWNAIDPNIVLDREGRPWLAFGSFWSGIKLRRIDAETGKLSAADPTLYALAKRPRGQDGPPWGAIEAPFIIPRDGFFYLFVSFDQCCKGADSTYRIMVGRSPRLIGPYVDARGVPLLQGGGTPVVAAAGQWRGPGHNAVLQEQSGDSIVYHAYDADDGGTPKLRIGSLVWDADGWPLAAAPDAMP
jgi:arabinan endo-1,5-alpha-L-arabinosidase